MTPEIFPAGHKRPFDSIRIMLAEDEARVRRATKDVLGMQDYSVLECETTEQTLAQNAVTLLRVDLLPSDVVLPGKSGEASCARKRRQSFSSRSRFQPYLLRMRFGKR